VLGASTLRAGLGDPTRSTLRVVRVRVGPVSSGGVALWVAYARTVISQSLVRPAELGVTLTPEVAELFDTYLDAWEQAATTSATFEWEAQVPTDQILSLGGTWFLIANHLSEVAEHRGYPISPPEGEEFYRALITAFLAGLDDEGGTYATMADEFRAEWPGLKVDDS
jgi:hypothetical protein